MHTASGRLRGVRDGGVVRFRGIPYAQPPTGVLRWSPPRPVSAWTGTRSASQSGPQCEQPAQPGAAKSVPMSEDCLYLNVTVPARRFDRGNPRPLMVWLHGGGFSVGSATEDDPRRLAEQGNVVVATVDFRLGVFGNLALPGMTDGGSFGLQDQQAALRWLRRSAPAFGADPNNITLFGQSGGAVAVCGQLTSPTARTLFAKAVLQSGSCDTTLAANSSGPGTPAFGSFWTPLASAQHASARAAAALGCNEPATALSCVRRVAASRLLTQTDTVSAAAYDTRVLPADPSTANPARDDRPVLSGTTLDEQRLVANYFRLARKPITAATYPVLLRSAFGADAADIETRYPARAYGSAELAWAAVYTDSGFVCPQVRTDDRLAQRSRVIGYEFADRSAPPLIPSAPGFAQGASHASELFYLFDIRGLPARLNGSTYGLTAAQRKLADQMIRAWSTFAHSGTPQSTGSWPRWSDASNTVHRFTADATHPDIVDVATEHHCAFWQGLADRPPHP